MKKLINHFIFTWLLVLTCSDLTAQSPPANGYRLIAHRGGVEDSTADENSLQALQKAVSMVTG